ncbi:hypothetical protein EJ06DRAFT_463307, partial [Trichodelitschia bisporula]
MRIPPADVIAKWPPSNYVDPVRRGPELFIASSIFLGLATLAVAGRIYARLVVQRWFGLDDVFILIAFVTTLGVSGVVFFATAHLDWDRHVWDVELDMIPPSLKAFFAVKIMWAISSSFIRLSLLAFYYRLLDHCQIHRFRWLLHAATTWHIALLLVYLFTTVLACLPIHAYWTFPAPAGSVCVSEASLMMIWGALNTFSELVVALLPLPVVLRLHLTPRQRFTVIALLSLGILVIGASCARLFFLWRAFASYDLTWWSNAHWICSEVEIDAALICACAPALRPVLASI